MKPGHHLARLAPSLQTELFIMADLGYAALILAHDVRPEVVIQIDALSGVERSGLLLESLEHD